MLVSVAQKPKLWCPKPSQATKSEIKKIVKSEIKATLETKQIANSYLPIGVLSTTTGDLFTVGSPIAGAGNPGQQGTGIYNRIGDEILVHEAEFNCEVTLAAAGSQTIRWFMICVPQPDGTATTLGDMLYETGASLSVYSPYAYHKMKEWGIRVLASGQRTLTSNYNVAGNPVSPLYIKKKFKKPIKQSFANNTTAAGIAAYTKNAIQFIIVSSAANVSLRNAQSSVLFTDA